MAVYSLNADEQSKAKTVVDYLVKNGMTQAGASGVAGNIKCESSFKTSSEGWDVNGTSGGLCQWHKERLTNLKNFAKQKGKDWTDMQLQLDFLLYEIQNNNKRYGTLVSVLKSTNSPSDASYQWGYDFERFDGFNNRNSASHTKRRGYSEYIYQGVTTGGWQGLSLSGGSSSSSSASRAATTTKAAQGKDNYRGTELKVIALQEESDSLSNATADLSALAGLQEEYEAQQSSDSFSIINKMSDFSVAQSDLYT